MGSQWPSISREPPAFGNHWPAVKIAHWIEQVPKQVFQVLWLTVIYILHHYYPIFWILKVQENNCPTHNDASFSHDLSSVLHGKENL